MDIIRGGKPDKRVLLMTATPINNSVWDLYHQLMLITTRETTLGTPDAVRYLTYERLSKQSKRATQAPACWTP